MLSLYKNKPYDKKSHRETWVKLTLDFYPVEHTKKPLLLSPEYYKWNRWVYQAERDTISVQQDKLM